MPDFMQAAGYSTWYTGKLMNGHTVENCERLPVSGFVSYDSEGVSWWVLIVVLQNSSDFLVGKWIPMMFSTHAYICPLLDPYTYDYWNVGQF